MSAVRCLVQRNVEDGMIWSFLPESGYSACFENFEEAQEFWKSEEVTLFQALGARGNAGTLSRLLDWIWNEEPRTRKVLIGCPRGYIPNLDFDCFAEWAAVLSNSWSPHSQDYLSQDESDQPRELKRYFDGFWHTATAGDLAVYGLMDEMQKVDPDPEKLQALLRRHPSFLVWEFMRQIPLQTTCRLLADIGDVRWFRHPEQPERVSRLGMFCGVYPKYAEKYWMRILFSPRKDLPGRLQRAYDLVAIWSSLAFCPFAPLEELVDFYSMGDEDEDVAWFFTNLVLLQTNLGAGIRKSCRKFLELLMLSWTDGLYLLNGRRPPQMIDPQEFFCVKEEKNFAAMADRWEELWNHHMTRLAIS